ncbi:MAG: EAL domain-containing protein [Piscinibacter sp.]|nr:EAL domain-containing protein [Piscinibacter sp.]
MPSLILRIIGRLSVGKKLLLIFLLDMSAVAYISGILVNEKFLAIDFARKELAGNAYIAAVRGSLLEAAASLSSGLPVSAEAADAVAGAERRHGAGMVSAEASAALGDALARHRGAPADGGLVKQVLAEGRALVTRVGNQSNLILDPDLDSYYTMSIIVLRVPELLQTVTDIALHAPGAAGDADAAPSSTPFLVLEGRLETGWKGLESDFGEAFAAGSPPLRQALEPARQRLAGSMERFRAAARRHFADGEAATAPGADALLAAHRAVVADIDQAWRASMIEMDHLLQRRIDGFFARMWLHLGTALGLLLLILSAVFFVARQIAVPLRRLAGVADDVRQSGDYALRAGWHSRDEIGRLVNAFNEMLDRLGRERAAQQELAARERAAQAQLRLVEAIPIPIMVTAVPGHQVLHANRPAQAWLGDSTADPWRRGLEKAVRARFFQQLADRDAVDEFEVRWNPRGEASWAVLSARQLEFQGHNAVLTAFTPINHLKLMERRLELWAKVFEASGEGIVIIDTERRVMTANAAFCASTGFDLHELIGEPIQPRPGGPGPMALMTELEPALAKRNNWQGEVSVQRRDGSCYPAWLMLSVVREGQQGGVSHFIATTIDITDRKRNEERIRFLAQHDVLTELPNRSLCQERLRLAVQQAARRGDRVAVLFIDLDRFKNINDSLGHHIGDGLLRSVAQRLTGSVRAGDTVSRLGGDEFVVVLGSVADANEVAAMVEERLVPGIRAPHDIDGAEIHVSCSVGIALYPDDAGDIDTLMRHADAAMYQAKSLGRDAAQFFSPDLNERAQRRLKVESNLRRAIERGELSLHYQPRLHATSGRIRGVEALLRWTSAELGVVAPAQFIAVAEEAQLIVDIGAWVIGEACAQLARWRAQGLDVPQVSINVSALQLRDDGLVQTLRAALERYALPPGTVELELTESTLMDRAEQTLERLHAIKRLGVQLAIDDFGTGYSSLNYLNRFPIDRLKVDRSFVRDMFEDPTDLAITRAIIGLGHTLGLSVVAEGVETEREAQTLRELGCDELQGFHFCMPVEADRLAHWLGGRRLRLAT